MSKTESRVTVYPDNLELDRVFDAEVITEPETEPVPAPEAKTAPVAAFDFDGITITKGPRSDSEKRTTILPIVNAAEDGRLTELISGYIRHDESQSAAASHTKYKRLVTAIDTENADEAASMLSEAARYVRGSGDDDFEAPAAFILNQKGELAWSVSKGQATTCLIRIRRNQAFERLGDTNEDSHGVIRDLNTKDAIYIVPTELADKLQAANQLNEASIKAAFLDKDGPDIIRTKFTDAFAESEASQAAKLAKNRQKLRHRVTNGVQMNPDQTNLPSGDTHDNGDTEPSRPQGAADTSTMEPINVIPMGIMNSVNDALRAEKKLANLNYLEERVFASEALAASVVAKRSKGKLFRGKKATETIEQRNELLDKRERWTALFDKAQLDQWSAEGLSNDEAMPRLISMQESRALRRAEQTKQEMTKRPFDALMNKYVNLPKKQKVLYGLAAGALLGVAGAAAGGTLGVAGLVGIGVAKAVKTHIQSKAEVYKDAGSAPKAANREYTIKTRHGTVTRQYTANELVKVSAQSERDTRHTSFDRADKISRKAAIMTGLAGAALIGGGILKFAEHHDVVVDAFRHIHDNIFGGAPSHAPVLPGNNVAPPHEGYNFSPTHPPVPSHDSFVPTDLGGATEFKAAGLDHFNQWVSGHTVQPGESVWKLSQDYLQANGVKHPSVFQIDAVKDKVLAEFSAKGLVDGRGWLMAGQQLNIK